MVYFEKSSRLTSQTNNPILPLYAETCVNLILHKYAYLVSSENLTPILELNG